MYNDKIIHKVVIWECFWISLWQENEALSCLLCSIGLLYFFIDLTVHGTKAFFVLGHGLPFLFRAMACFERNLNTPDLR